MTNTYLPIHLDVQKSVSKIQSNQKNVTPASEGSNRRRSNSQSQVVSTPAAENRTKDKPSRRNNVLYFVTLTPLNDTFIKKHLLVPYFPETRKLGRPAGSKVKPDITNGFFDSRVLSRSHAAMFIDSNSGKLMLKDLGSSNGTYVNEERIGSDPVEIKIGDIIYLGFNIQADTNHKQISAKVENINVMQNFYSSSSTIPSSFNFKNQHSMDTPEFKHYNFIQDIISKIPNSNGANKPNDEQNLSFENALFGDINPNIEDTLLGLHSNGNCGIFNNAQITNASSLDSAIKILTNNLSKIKQQNNALSTLEEFVINYQTGLDERNSKFLKHEFDTKLKTVHDELSQERASSKGVQEKHEKYKTEVSQLLENLRKEVLSLTNEKHALNEKLEQLYKLKEAKLKGDFSNPELKESDNIDSVIPSGRSVTNGNLIPTSDKRFNNNSSENQEFTISSLNIDLPTNEHPEEFEETRLSIILKKPTVMNSSDKKEDGAEENQLKLTPPSSDNEPDSLNEVLGTVRESRNIDLIRPGENTNKESDCKARIIPELLQLLPLQDKITLALYVAFFALVLQSIDKNQGIILGFSIALFIYIVQRLSKQS